jgi:cytochrome c
MRRYCRTLALLGLTCLHIGVTSAQQGPGLGVPATDDDIAAWDLSIGPDGDGLPAGFGTAVQGEAIYQATCLACHGEGGQGQLNDRLVGGHGSLSGDAPVKTVGSYWPYATTIFDYIRRAMPYTASQSLSNDEVYALTAYLLFLNGIVAEEDSMDADSLPAVMMPNRDNFVIAYPGDPDAGN